MNYKKINRIRGLSLTLITMIMIVAAGNRNAFTADMKVFPGALCVGQGDFNSSINYVSSGGVFNSSSISPRSIICPVVRDNPTARYEYIKVVVIDRHPSLNVACEVRANSRSGQDSNKTVELSSSGSLTTGQVLTFAAIPDYDYGTYTINCVIPPVDPLHGGASGIASYSISEP